jgi:hypothetical protein
LPEGKEVESIDASPAGVEKDAEHGVSTRDLIAYNFRHLAEEFQMKRFDTAIILSMSLALLGCGLSSPSSETITGNWKAGIANPDGTLAFGFTATLTQSGQSVSVTKLSVSPPSSCFAPGTTATAQLTMTDTTHGAMSGTFQMIVQSGPSNANGTNTLALQGMLVRNSVSGTWALTATGTQCAETENSTSGNFSMVQM